MTRAKTRRCKSRRRDRRKTDSGGDWKRKVESPFKWTWHHDLLPHYVAGEVTGKGPGLKKSVDEEFTWKGIHNKGGRRRRRRTRRGKRRTRGRRARGRRSRRRRRG